VEKSNNEQGKLSRLIFLIHRRKRWEFFSFFIHFLNAILLQIYTFKLIAT
jgi:hypothetical protein